MAAPPSRSRRGRRGCRSGWSRRTRYSSSISSRPWALASSSTVTLEHVDARLVAAQRLLDFGADPLAASRAVDRLEDQLVDAAAEIGAHHALAGRGLENDADRLADILLVFGRGDAAACAGRRRPASPSPAPGSPCARPSPVTRSSPSAHRAAIALGAPASTTISPCRAAGRPPIITVVLPTATTPPTCGFTPSTSGQA